MTSASFLRFLALATVVIATPAVAQSTQQPVASRPTPPVTPQPTVANVPVPRRAVPPAALPALASARQTPTPPVVLPPTQVLINTASPAAAQTSASAQVAAVAPNVAPVQPAPAVAAPLPVINQTGLPPSNATGRCKDGTYLAGSAATDANCSTHGGLGVAFPAPSQPPPRAQVRQP